MPVLALETALQAAASVHACFAGHDTENHCDIASDTLAALLVQRGYDPRVIGGTFFYDSHFWVECDGILMDPTIDQFDDGRPMACIAAEARGRMLYEPGDRPVLTPLPDATVALLARAGAQYPDSAPVYAAMHDLLTA